MKISSTSNNYYFYNFYKLKLNTFMQQICIFFLLSRSNMICINKFENNLIKYDLKPHI